MTSSEQVALARRIAGSLDFAKVYSEARSKYLNDPMMEDYEIHLMRIGAYEAALAAIIETTELAAKMAVSDGLILSESRKPGTFGRARKDHGELIASQLCAFAHLKGPTHDEQ